MSCSHDEVHFSLLIMLLSLNYDRRMLIKKGQPELKGEPDFDFLEKELGRGACLACRSKVCQWKTTVDADAIAARRKEIDSELERVRGDVEAKVFFSNLTLSSQMGGSTIFSREDIMLDLDNEARELDRRLHLNDIDKELHDCYNSRSEYVEVKHLHGYSTVLWANNARKALTARQNRLVAMNVAQTCISDILDFMLEGWYFGERESQFTVAGFVPSIKKEGFLGGGSEQVEAISIAIAKAKARQEVVITTCLNVLLLFALFVTAVLHEPHQTVSSDVDVFARWCVSRKGWGR